MYKYYSVKQEAKKNRNILFTLPESLLILDVMGNVRFANSFMKSRFVFDSKKLDQNFLEQFGDLKYREYSKDYKLRATLSSHVITNLRTPMSKTDIKHNLFHKMSSNQQAREALLENIQGLKSLKELVNFFTQHTIVWHAQDDLLFIFDTKFYRPDLDITLSVEVRVFIFSDGDFTQLVMTFRDTTERDRIATLENENIIFRNNVLASFSHELRTPLNANLAFLEQSLSSTQVPKKIKKEFLVPAMVSSRLLLSLVDDILDYSQFIMDKLEIKKYNANIKHTIERCVKLFKEKANAKGIDLVVDICKDAPTKLFTDHQRISQILVNLLGNAIKFANSGMIKVAFQKQELSAFNLSVTDTGIGLSEEDVTRLRANLAKSELKAKLNSSSSGIGVGLFISNALAKALSDKQIHSRKQMSILPSQS